MKKLTTPNYGPRRGAKSTRNWKTEFTAQDRDYDPARDGWNTHVLRRQPSVDELLAARDEPSWDW